MLTPDEQFDETVGRFTATGKVWFTDDEAQIQKLRDVVFPGGHLNKDVVGISAREVGAHGRHRRARRRARIILLPAKGAGDGRHPRAREALPGRRDPALREVRGRRAATPRPTCWSKAPAIRRRCTRTTRRTSATPGSSCRSAGWWSTSRSSLTAGGSLTNGFAPTTTLGCGSWGGNSISENLDYKHLMNVSRIGKVIEGKQVPTDEEIWA